MLCCPPFCNNMSLTVTFQINSLGWRFWCLELCFYGQGIRRLFWPMTLAFQGHDLCKITFWVISMSTIRWRSVPHTSRCWRTKGVTSPGGSQWGYISVINGDTRKLLDWFGRGTYGNALHCPTVCRNMSLTITFELNHLGWRFWCLDLCF